MKCFYFLIFPARACYSGGQRAKQTVHPEGVCQYADLWSNEVIKPTAICQKIPILDKVFEIVIGACSKDFGRFQDGLTTLFFADFGQSAVTLFLPFLIAFGREIMIGVFISELAFE